MPKDAIFYVIVYCIPLHLITNNKLPDCKDDPLESVGDGNGLPCIVPDMLLGKVSTGDKYSPPLSTESYACCCCCSARSRGLSFIPGGAMNFEYGFPGADGIRLPATCFGALAVW